MLKRGCNKCERLKNKEFFWENDSVAAYFSRQDFKGHTVVLLKRHVEHLSKLTPKECKDFMTAWSKIAGVLQKTIKPDIINYQINCNWEGHIHGHIYPRFKKDDACFGEPICIPKKNANFKKKELSETEKKKIISLIKKIRRDN